MALLAISGQPGLRTEEVARLAAERLEFELITQARLENLYDAEFPSGNGISARGYADLVTVILARLAGRHHLVFCGWGGQYLFRGFPGVLRVMLTASPAARAGWLMIDQTLPLDPARAALRQMDLERSGWLRARFGRGGFSGAHFDLTLNAERWDSPALAEAVVAGARALGMEQGGLLPAAAERQLQFEARARLARLGVAAPGAVSPPSRQFAHPSEEFFANLLDFYRIAWEYEPRSFPIVWDEQGRVLESFTPDFFLPESDVYVELTTMKQSLVTKKNRKIKRLRELYPEVNVQVFYQKDFENLIFKYGLEKTAEMLGEAV